jgi:hypothetical protein
MKTLMLAALVLAVGAADVAAQTLADIARQEKERRAALAAASSTDTDPPKVYTQADLRTGRRLTTTRELPPPPTSPPSDASTDDADAEDGAAAPANEEQWRGRMEAARQALTRAEMMAAALQNRVDGLTTAFASRDDPAQRDIIDQNRQAALTELENTNAEVEDLTQQISDIEAEARRESVPPGWLRQ